MKVYKNSKEFLLDLCPDNRKLDDILEVWICYLLEEKNIFIESKSFDSVVKGFYEASMLSFIPTWLDY